VSVDVAADTIRFATDAKIAMSEKTVKLQLPEEIALIDTVRHGAGTADSWALQLKGHISTSPAHFAYMVRILDDARDVSRAWYQDGMQSVADAAADTATAGQTAAPSLATDDAFGAARSQHASPDSVSDAVFRLIDRDGDGVICFAECGVRCVPFGGHFD
jgi:hypothetical protein